MPEQAALSLMRLVVLMVGTDSATQLRADRLGLLIELLDGVGTIPDSGTYARAHAERALRGESWPTHTTLVRAYGSWLDAVKAAMSTLHGYGRPASYRKPSRSAAFAQLDCLDALHRCREDLGPWPSEDHWPNQSEYALYRQIARQAAARAGMPTPLLPSTGVIRRKCGRWEQAIAQAKVERLDGAGNAASSPCRASRAPAPSAGSLGKAPRT